MRRLKIIISTNSSWNLVNFREGLIRALVVDGHEVVALANDEGHGAELAGMGCRLVPLPLTRRGRSPLGEANVFARYVWQLAKQRPDIYLSFTIKPNLYGAWACRGLGVTAVVNVAGLGSAFLERGIFNRFIKALYRSALAGVPVAFFQNAQDRALFICQGLVAAERARLLPGSGVDLTRFTPAPDAGLYRPDPVFLLVARLLWAKGLAEYVEAARVVAEVHPNARFLLLGLPEDSAGAVPAEVVAEWHEHGPVEYLGFTRNVRPALAQADCVVLPTFYPEGTPRALIEAAAMGKPLIATDVAGCRDIVRHRGNGFLCAPRDPAALANAMLAFAALGPAERQRMGRESRTLAETEFDEQLVVKAYRRAIAEATGGIEAPSI